MLERPRVPASQILDRLLVLEMVRVTEAAAVALLFIASMLAVGLGFGVFLVETRLGSRAVRIRSELLAHEADPDD